jgi:hypothetical protein
MVLLLFFWLLVDELCMCVCLFCLCVLEIDTADMQREISIIMCCCTVPTTPN